MSRVHVVGAGLAGLSAAVRLVDAGIEVSLHEAAGQAGGRCRSLADAMTGRRIDNGNHLMLSGNREIMDYLILSGADPETLLAGPERAEFSFVDLADGARRWTIRPNPGRLPWWLLLSSRRVPGTSALDYLSGLKLARAKASDRVAELLKSDGQIWRRFWEPLAVGVLNTEPERAAAAPLWPVLRQTFGRGEAACRPRIARQGLSESLVDPALAFLDKRGAEVSFNHRLKALAIDTGRLEGLIFNDTAIRLSEGDAVILAVPPAAAASLVPDLVAPMESRAIVNVHYRLQRTQEKASLLGVVGGIAQWIFVRGDMASVTVSAADAIAERTAEAIAEAIWPEVVAALELGQVQIPPYRVVKEKRATIAQTPEQTALRPPCRTRWPNLFLAGDWTATGLPATIEGAVLSGRLAAEAARNS